MSILVLMKALSQSLYEAMHFLTIIGDMGMGREGNEWLVDTEEMKYGQT